MVCREAAGLENDMAKRTWKRYGGLLHVLKNRANETKLTQENVFSIKSFEK